MGSLPADHDARLARAMLSLDGLSIGDALGQQFFGPVAVGQVVGSKLPLPPWRYTDDTEMACAIVGTLRQHGTIHQDALAQMFAQRYAADPHRCYGYGMHVLMEEIGRGRDWREAASELFHGEGSLGNGSAMRVAPLGGYFADDYVRTAQEARLSAEVTHRHAEGSAGAIAVAVAAAWAWQWQEAGRTAPRESLLATAYEFTPPGRVRQGIKTALTLPLEEWEFTAAECLGNGEQITCIDTVPFCLWVAARHLDDFAKAIWATIRVGGDIDTTAAIVGGIVALAVGESGIPEDWRRMREGLALGV